VVGGLRAGLVLCACEVGQVLLWGSIGAGASVLGWSWLAMDASCESAIVGLHSWLLDAMEGTQPVSARTVLCHLCTSHAVLLPVVGLPGFIAITATASLDCTGPMCGCLDALGSASLVGSATPVLSCGIGSWFCGLWHVVLVGLLVAFGVMEGSRIPADLPECESELVSGYVTELAGLGYGLLASTE
jgi:hypothetical protein